MFEEYSRVALTIDLPEYDLIVGDVGTIVEIFGNGKDYLVEFNTREGYLVAMTLLTPLQLRNLSPMDVTNVRVLEKA